MPKEVAPYQIIVYQDTTGAVAGKTRLSAFRTNRPLRTADISLKQRIIFVAEGPTLESAEEGAIWMAFELGILDIEGLLELEPDTRRALEEACQG